MVAVANVAVHLRDVVEAVAGVAIHGRGPNAAEAEAEAEVAVHESSPHQPHQGKQKKPIGIDRESWH